MWRHAIAANAFSYAISLEEWSRAVYETLSVECACIGRSPVFEKETGRIYIVLK